MRVAKSAVCFLALGFASSAVGWAKQPKPKQVAVAGTLNTFVGDVLTRANENTDYRRVLYTGQKTQLVVMSIPSGSDVGEESHRRVEQLIFCASGNGKAVINGKSSAFKAGDVIVATPGTRHNVKNTGKTPLKLYTIYSPPNHLDNRVQTTKAAAEVDREDHEFGRQVDQGGGHER